MRLRDRNLLLIVLAFPYYAILATRQTSGIMLATIVMLGLVHPITRQPISWQSALPDDFSAMLDSLRRRKRV